MKPTDLVRNVEENPASRLAMTMGNVLWNATKETVCRLSTMVIVVWNVEENPARRLATMTMGNVL